MTANNNNNKKINIILNDVAVKDENSKKRIASMTDEEIIEENLREILEKKSREERKANGRLIAMIVAFLVIFLGIYHIWMRKKAVLAGILVPAIIMLSYGVWVVILAKRDKRRRAVFEQHLEEVALKNKAELDEKAKIKRNKKSEKSLNETTKVHFENEITTVNKNNKDVTKTMANTNGNGNDGANLTIEKRKQRKQQRSKHYAADDVDSTSNSSSSNKRKNNSQHLNKDLRIKRPSIRQKLFRQSATCNVVLINDAISNGQAVPLPLITTAPAATKVKVDLKKKKRLQRLNALLPSVPLVRMSSAP